MSEKSSSSYKGLTKLYCITFECFEKIFSEEKNGGIQGPKS